jgi:hypothetical protein
MSDAADTPLLADISDAFEDIAPVPPHLTDAAKAAFAWRRADAELADLLFDSSTDELVGIRGTTSDRRSFRFGHGDVVIRVHLTPATLIVMIEPPLSVPCRVATGDQTDQHRTDDYGEVVVDAPDLPARIEVDLPGGTVITPWITG